jgi:hypothetical protein
MQESEFRIADPDGFALIIRASGMKHKADFRQPYRNLFSASLFHKQLQIFDSPSRESGNTESCYLANNGASFIFACL